MKRIARPLIPLLLLVGLAVVSMILIGAPQSRQPGGTGFAAYAPYFKVDQGFETILVLRNQHVRTPLRVAPVIYGQNGAATGLPEVEIAANSVVRLSLGPALQQAGSQISSGALALEYSGPNTLMAMAIVRDQERSIIFGFPFRGGFVNGESRILDANWWLRDEETEGRLALFNSSDQTITVRMEAAGNQTRFALETVSLAPKQFREMRLRRLLLDAGIRGVEMGSLTLSYDGPAHALVPGLFSFNEENGFSLTSSFAARQPNTGTEATTTMHVPKMLIHRPGYATGFPYSVRFSAFALLSNLTDDFLPVEIVASYETGSQLKQVALPGVRLAPAETRLLNLGESGLIPNEVGGIGLRVVHTGPPTAAAARFFSMDPSGNWLFTAEGMPSGARLFDTMIWDVAGNSTSMIIIQNIGEVEASVRVTLSFDEGRGSYKVPLLAIPAGATRTVNVNQVIAAGERDEDGNQIPPHITYGSAKIQAQGENAMAARLTVVAAAYDPVRGMCAEYLGGCPIPVAAYLEPDPAVGFVGTAMGMNGIIEYEDFVYESFSPQLFGTNSSVAQTSGYWLSFVGPGSTNVHSMAEVLQRPSPLDQYSPCYPTTLWAQAGVQSLLPPPPPPPSVSVTTADIVQDQIVVSLSPGGSSGTLVVRAQGPSINKVVFNGTRSGGQHTFSFDRNNLPDGQYTSVTAQWTVGGASPSGSKSVSFNVLGTYRHSQYNTPAESACIGAPAQAYITNPQCNFTATNLRNDFISQSWLNGSGITINFGTEQNEAFCLSHQNAPPNASGRSFRPQAIIPSCGSAYSVNNLTVAKGDDAPLICGDSVLIVGLGGTATVKAVTDRCPACTGQLQLDNYTTQTACQPGTIPDLGNFKTIRLR